MFIMQDSVKRKIRRCGCATYYSRFDPGRGKNMSKINPIIKILILFMLLLAAFFVTWTIKANTPVNRPENAETGTAAVWYEKHTETALTVGDTWTLDPRVPVNYIPVPGEDGIYMVVDDAGVVVKYMKAEEQTDGSLLWSETLPEYATVYTPVDDVENVYSYTDENGETAYTMYVRNEDNTFAFIDTDQWGIPLDNLADATIIGSDFTYTGSGNTYAKTNELGVLVGYYERLLDEMGQYVWQYTSQPELSLQVGNAQGLVISGTEQETSAYEAYVDTDSENASRTTETASDGSYTVTNRTVSTETSNGVTTTYETDTVSVYLADGTLYRTSVEGPYVINQTQAVSGSGYASAGTPETTLSAEYVRICSLVSFDTSTASAVLAALNARRSEDGLATLAMDTSSDLYMAACIRAGDMALEGSASSVSQNYGTIDDLCAAYGISGYVLENVWGTSGQTSDDIHLRFQAVESSRLVRESSGISACAIAIAVYNGQQYICELFR